MRKGLGCQIPGVKKWRWGGEAARCKQDVKGGGGEKREKNKKEAKGPKGEESAGLIQEMGRHYKKKKEGCV